MQNLNRPTLLGISARRPLAFFLSGLLAFGLLAVGSLVITSPAAAAPIPGSPTTSCADPATDGSMDTGAGTMITCDTSITNTITAIDSGTGVATGTSTVTVTECRGPASGKTIPSALTCTPPTTGTYSQLATTVIQCVGVGYGGGNVLRCNLAVVNDWVGVTPQAVTAVTVTQCIIPEAGPPPTAGCSPAPVSTINATITQCNDSGYSGTNVDFICTATGTESASLSMTLKQCNGSTYGGGGSLTCSASLTNNIIVLATPTPTPTATPTPEPTATPTPEPTATPTTEPTATPTPEPTAVPTATPTAVPTPAPTAIPTATPTPAPTAIPTATPTPAPTAIPTATPTPAPTAIPTATPTPAPTAIPTATPTPAPTATVAPAAPATPAPTATPAHAVLVEPQPTQDAAAAPITTSRGNGSPWPTPPPTDTSPRNLPPTGTDPAIWPGLALLFVLSLATALGRSDRFDRPAGVDRTRTSDACLDAAPA